MERTASRHEGDRATQEFGLPACALGGHVTQVTGQEETPGEGQLWKLALRGGPMHSLAVYPHWVCFT